MSKPIQLGDGASLESVDAAYKASQECHDRERLLAMRLAHQGNQTLAQIGVILKRVRATIARWVKAYREGGIQKLLHRGHGGRKASLCHSDQEGMIEELYSGCWKISRYGFRKN
jgi:transposase